MERWKRRAVDLLTSIAFGGCADSSVVPYYPQKVEIGETEPPCFRRAYPEKHGMSSGRIYSMLCELEGERRANMHSIMVLCGGEVISECSADGYDTRSWQVSHSMAKSVVGVIIGGLVDDEMLSLDARLVDLFPEIEYRDKRFPLVTVEHLLTMTSGVDFAEAGAVTELEWTKAFFNATVRFGPGSRFSYNSMNSYILVRVAERVSGEPFGVLARKRFFAPMGIKSYLWEKSPEGSEKGGWGLYMSPQSWAKIGCMMLWGGKYGGKQIVSEDWVRNSTATKAITPEENGGFNYGYQVWTARDSDQFLLNGMLGQNVWVCPRNDVVVVMTGGNNEIFQTSAALEIVRKYLGSGLNDRLDRSDQRLLRQKESSFFNSRRWVCSSGRGVGLLFRLGILRSLSGDKKWDNVLGKYAFGDNNVSIMPLTLRMMQNNLDAHLESIMLSRRGDDLLLSFCESSVEYKLAVGLDRCLTNLFICRGEQYVVRAIAGITQVGGEDEYRIELAFSETSSVRRLKIKKSTRDRVEVALSETPNQRLVENLIENYSKTNSLVRFVVDIIERRFGVGAVKQKIESGFNPVLIGADMSVNGYEKIVAAQTEKAAERSSGIKMLRAVVDRFINPDD